MLFSFTGFSLVPAGTADLALLYTAVTVVFVLPCVTLAGEMRQRTFAAISYSQGKPDLAYYNPTGKRSRFVS